MGHRSMSPRLRLRGGLALACLVAAAALLAGGADSAVVAVDGSFSDWKPGSAKCHSENFEINADKGAACGYGNVYSDSYGDMRTSASARLFNDGDSCGACFEVQCDSTLQPGACKKDARATVTVTDLCVPNPARGKSDPCKGARAKHMALPCKVFSSIVNSTALNAQSAPILFRRVPCKRVGGIQFQINGNPGQLQVNIRNVADAGTIDAVWLKTTGTHTWVPMTKSWGENWLANSKFKNKVLSFKVYSKLTRKTVIATNVVPKVWKFGATYTGGQFSLSR